MYNPKKNKRKILVTQALPYANAPLHLGHILEAVQTDIWTRFQNINNNECYFFCADDTHGTPVMLKARELGVSPEKLIAEIHKDHESTYKLYNIKGTETSNKFFEYLLILEIFLLDGSFSILFCSSSTNDEGILNLFLLTNSSMACFFI